MQTLCWCVKSPFGDRSELGSARRRVETGGSLADFAAALVARVSAPADSLVYYLDASGDWLELQDYTGTEVDRHQLYYIVEEPRMAGAVSCTCPGGTSTTSWSKRVRRT